MSVFSHDYEINQPISVYFYLSLFSRTQWKNNASTSHATCIAIPHLQKVVKNYFAFDSLLSNVFYRLLGCTPVVWEAKNRKKTVTEKLEGQF